MDGWIEEGEKNKGKDRCPVGCYVFLGDFLNSPFDVSF